MKRFAPRSFRRPALPVIGTSALRIAQISPTACFDGANLFPLERWKDLPGFAPNVLVGSASDLQRLLERISLRTLELSSIDHAVFMLTAVGDKPATDALRCDLWREFGTPAYELYVSAGGALLASECEAQQGWHVEPGARFIVQDGELYLALERGPRSRTGLIRTLEDAPCGCGRPGLRIMTPADCPSSLPSPVFEPLPASAA